MKAIVCEKSGPPDVRESGEADKPAPRDNEVLARIGAPLPRNGPARGRIVIATQNRAEPSVHAARG